ncbi:MAG: hypothetical protein LBH44_09920 [Treponema sp.]|jgi:hypothetical protein|nr:hypothetical protein [Treponema sp.]
MLENSLQMQKWGNGDIDKMVILEETKDLYNYSIANNLDDIQIAIYARTGHNINLDKAYWKLNSKLSISVKHLMNTHYADYSMTINNKGKYRQVIINMRVGDKWYITKYDEVKSIFCDCYLIEAFKSFKSILLEKLHSDDDE